ncbi:MAG: pantetheine-phosphate adenylyltransferase [Treponema sp.]|nr:pantetheine-phosphate adenylyltransferase [Treponema sp.]
MISVIYAGSFDPPTYGHLNIIERARTIYEKIHVVVAVNSTKKYLFSEEERVSMLKELLKDYDNVEVSTCDTLIVDYAKKLGVRVLLRGVRNVGDFSYEFDLAMLNKGLDSNMETVFLPTDSKYFVLKSSAIKEVASFGGDVSAMVPPLVEQKLKNKYKKA